MIASRCFDSLLLYLSNTYSVDSYFLANTYNVFILSEPYDKFAASNTYVPFLRSRKQLTVYAVYPSQETHSSQVSGSLG